MVWIGNAATAWKVRLLTIFMPTNVDLMPNCPSQVFLQNEWFPFRTYPSLGWADSSHSAQDHGQFSGFILWHSNVAWHCHESQSENCLIQVLDNLQTFLRDLYCMILHIWCKCVHWIMNPVSSPHWMNGGTRLILAGNFVSLQCLSCLDPDFKNAFSRNYSCGDHVLAPSHLSQWSVSETIVGEFWWSCFFPRNNSQWSVSVN